MLLKRYAKCLDGRQGQNNLRIEAALTPRGPVHDWSTISERQRERAGLRETGGPPDDLSFALVSG